MSDCRDAAWQVSERTAVNGLTIAHADTIDVTSFDKSNVNISRN